MKTFRLTFGRVTTIIALTMGVCLTENASAQLNPLGSTYFVNQYLANPAMAGRVDGLRLNAGYRKQWTSMPGTPSTQSLTGDYALNTKVGLGLDIYNDKAGLLQRTKVRGTYAYHLPLNTADDKLSFGLSASLMNERINYNDVNGDPTDSDISRFNDKPLVFDFDFGVAYTNDNLTIQAAVPAMRHALRKEDKTYPSDQAVAFTSLSYKMEFEQALGGISVEPKVNFRYIRGYDNIVDLGANIMLADNVISVMGMYHTSRSASYGVGLHYNDITVLGVYTTPTSAMAAYANGVLELGLRLNLFED